MITTQEVVYTQVSKFTAWVLSPFSLRRTPTTKLTESFANQRSMTEKTFHVALPSPVVPHFWSFYGVCAQRLSLCVCVSVFLFVLLRTGMSV